ncbi:phosphatase PAP2 family protein [Marinobacterium sediminicola]|uniref:PAP2 superfamily protein n=1 Tax=Marinobacterium sediminicola TaxID=518898 RepID=A0ABY1S232_9GAMM|nr:phosphatase PAP2 family protein [Marinobacterium sediminicola]ULG69358.1 phosphatase PAP2 family protein [Marinobacterium sediminicola]SMR75505.1 PAP2 superfamily protein [Marinobacterium sediminicola]
MITPDPVFSTRWRPALLIGMHLAAAALLFSFVNESGRALWRSLDAQIFFALNGSLFASETWASFWAWMNTREVDAISALVMLVFLVFPGLGLKRNQLQAGFTGFLLLMILMLPMREALSEYSVSSGLSGHSPSLQLEPAYRFSTELPDIPAKDSATTSFPGDHASVLMVWLGFLLFNARNLGTLAATALALFLMSPRLFGGAHWFTDAAVGGLSLALVTLAWACASPVPHWMNQGLMRLLGPLYRLAGRLPLLGRLPFFSG